MTTKEQVEQAFQDTVEAIVQAIVAEATARGGRFVDVYAVQRALNERGLKTHAYRGLGHPATNVREQAFIKLEESGRLRWLDLTRFDLAG